MRISQLSLSGLGGIAATTALAASAVVGLSPHQTPVQQAPQQATAVSANAADATATAKFTAKLQTSSPALAACFPYARAKVSVNLTTDKVGFDTFRINASGLKPNTPFTVFLIEQAGAPFGHVEYLGDIFSDRHGKANNTFKAIVEEAFAFNNATGDRADLNSIGFWFGDEKDDDSCLGAASPVTGFDGDAKAGVQMMNSGTTFLP